MGVFLIGLRHAPPRHATPRIKHGVTPWISDAWEAISSPLSD
jgi:hypothetical protein